MVIIRRKSMPVNVPAEEVMHALKDISAYSPWKFFSADSFKFIKYGQGRTLDHSGTYHISGSIENLGQTCIVTYSIWPGIEFWFFILILFVMLIGLLASIIRFSGSPIFLAAPVAFVFIVMIEADWQVKRCDERFVRKLIELKPKGKS